MIAATFGRGMYKVSISGVSEPAVDLYLRDSLLDTGERFPSPSNQPNPNDRSDQVFWWESPDIKVDTTPYYTPDALFDGVEFDELQDQDPHDALGRYDRQFDGPPESWVGDYAPGDEAPASDPERRQDWEVWYRIESIRI